MDIITNNQTMDEKKGLVIVIYMEAVKCRDALSNIKIPVVGCIMRDDSFILESRHLGLVPASESNNKKNNIQKSAKKMSKNIDLKSILRICNNTSALRMSNIAKSDTTRATIAIALDDSFNFYYEDNLDALRRAGAKIKFFSPTTDKTIPKCDGLYLGGGFPEVQALKLAKNISMKKYSKNSLLEIKAHERTVSNIMKKIAHLPNMTQKNSCCKIAL